MLGTSDCAGRIRPAVPQAPEWQSIGNEIDFAMIFARETRFVKWWRIVVARQRRSATRKRFVVRPDEKLTAFLALEAGS
jgi:hypothetical protein